MPQYRDSAGRFAKSPGGDFAITWSIDGAGEVKHVLLGIRDRALNGAPVLAVVLEDMRRMEFELFQTEGYGEWAPLQQTTIERKAEQGYPPKILQATEQLMDSLTGNLSAAGHVEHITESEVVYGTTVPWAIFHQTGTRFMPARPPVDVREADIRRWTKMVQAYVFGLDAGEVEAAGGGGSPFGLATLDPFGLAV
jgi:phage gpG-like protein